MAESRSTPWVIQALIATNVAMFLVEIVHGADPMRPTTQSLIELGASYPPLTLGGDWWRLVSSMFLHYGMIHIGLNMLCLYQARIVEELYGHVAFLVIYLIAGLGGGIATLLFGAANGASAGASGAVFGVYGAFGAFLVLRRSQIEAGAWQRTARSLGQFLLLNLIVGVAATSISLSAHAGGLVVGFAIGAALLAGEAAPRQRIVRAIGIAVIGIAATFVVVMTMKPGVDAASVQRLLHDADVSMTTRWNKLTAASGDDRVEPQLADTLERDVVAPYKQARAGVLSTPNLPPKLREAIESDTKLRIEDLSTRIALMREADPEKRAALISQLTQLHSQGDAIVATLLAELDRIR